MNKKYLQCDNCAGTIEFAVKECNPSYCIKCGGRMVIYDPIEAIYDRVSSRRWLDGSWGKIGE